MLRPALVAAALAALAAAAAGQAPAPAPAAGGREPVCPTGVAKAGKHYVLVVGPAMMARADNTTWPALAFNGSIVGPTLRAVDGEEVSIDVVNTFREGTSVHWHGLDVPDASWSDGVAGITQAPIPPGATFRYRFRATPAGTHWYHAHTGTQYADGLRGAFIVDPKKGAAKALTGGWDGEHTLVVADVGDAWSADVLADLQRGGMVMPVAGMPAPGGHLAGGGMAGMGGGGAPAAAPAAHGGRRRRGLAQVRDTVADMLSPDKMSGPVVADTVAAVNGVAAAAPAAAHGGAGAPTPAPAHGGGGAPPPALPDPQGGCTAQTTQDLSDVPYYGTTVNGMGYAASAAAGALGGAPAVFNVTKGKTYRLRVVNGASSWGYNVSVDGHGVDVVALDGYAVKPVATRGVVLAAGETADLKLVANASVANYWVRACTLSGYCGPAVLHYAGAPDPAADATLGAPPVAVGCQAAAVPAVLDPKNATVLRGAPVSEGGVGGPPAGAAARTVAMWMTLNSGEPAPPAGLTVVGYAPRPAPPPGCPNVVINGTLTPSSYCWSINWVVFGAPPALPVYGVSFDNVSLVEPRGGGAPAPAPAAARAGRRMAQHGGPPGGRPGPPQHGAAAAAAAAAAAPAAMMPSMMAANAASTAVFTDEAAAAVADYAVPVAAGSVLDVVFVNAGAMVHPMHVHGMGGWLLAAGNGDPPLTADGGVDTADGRVNVKDPPFRSTVPVPNAAPGLGNGFAVWRLVPPAGVWPLHCHIDVHAESGMLLYLVSKDAKHALGWPAPPADLACAAAARDAPVAMEGPTFSPFAPAAVK